MSSPRLVRVCRVQAVRQDKPFVFRAPTGEAIVLFQTDSGYVAVENRCPHAGGSLHDGRLKGDVLICPWHGWRFHLPTGECLTEYWARLRTFSVTESNGELFIRLEEKS